MDERRTQSRKSTNDYFMVYNIETNELIGRVMDLNGEGAMLISEAQVPVPKSIKCKMVMPRMIGRHKQIHFEAESKWCRKNTRLGWFEAGYRFSNFSDTHKEIIDELIKEWADKNPPMPATIGMDD